MKHELQVELLTRLRQRVADKAPQLGDHDSSVDVSTYTDPQRAEDERRVLFRGYPLPVAHVSELPEKGDFVTHDATGMPMVVVRGPGGPQAFINACRHRGSRVVTEACGRRKAFTCPYHAWSYDLSGSLIHVPRGDCFPSMDTDERGLVPLPTAVAGGFVWVVPDREATLDIDTFLGPLGGELESFGLGEHQVHRRVSQTLECNWKLVIDAFVEGYHLRSLHRDTVYRFFHADGLIFDILGQHVRSVGARRTIEQLDAQAPEQWNIRDTTTVFYYLFPSTILVFHPDWISHIVMTPLTPETSQYEHRMLIPAGEVSDEAKEHWDQTFDLIEGNVFQKEDLATAQSIQSTLHSGANETFPVGRIEYPLAHFHRGLAEALAASKA